MKPLLCLILSLAFFSFAHARLGETLQECEMRYGALLEKTGDPKNPQFIFKKDGTTIGINFLNGKAAQISYMSPKFSDLEIQKLLEVNSQGSKWQPDSKRTQSPSTVYSKEENFIREDQGAYAEHLVLSSLPTLPGTEFLNISSAEFKKIITAKEMPGF
jgi:hypothetical protein